MIDCPKCDSGILEETNTDSRQEWCDIYYECNKCEREFIRTITYKTQSELVESDELEEVGE